MERLSQRQPSMGAELGSHHAFFPLPSRHSQGDLYHQQRRGPASLVAQDHQNPRSFPNEESALKLLFLAIRRAAKKWTMPVHNWSQALNYFTVLWPERMPRPGRSA